MTDARSTAPHPPASSRVRAARFSGVAALSAAALLSVAACSNTAATSTATADAATSAAPTVSAAPATPEVREAVWTVDLGSEVWAPPTVDGAVAYVGALDGVLRAIDTDAGVVAWEFATGGQLRGSVAVADGTAFVVSDDGTLYAVAADGAQRWATVIGAPSAERAMFDTNGSRPVVADGVVYAAASGGELVAINVADGSVRWSVTLDGAIQVNLAYGDGLIHVGTMAGSEYAIDAATGTEVWSERTYAAVTTSPTVMGDLVVVGSRAASIQIREAATGEIAWITSFGGSWVQSAATPIDESSFVIGSSDYKAISAFSAASGEPLWLTRVTGWSWGIPVVADGVVYATQFQADYDQPWDVSLYALDAATGEIAWTANTGDALEYQPDGLLMHGAAAGPAVAGDIVIVGGLDGKVHAFKK